ncbi:MAG TPA: SusC/RagA family TonB-linked outer membrane protein [Porphyromonadaceae bacterium]|mgnify:CR=1 FL=1|jgi:TonB-linked SusC/RagA family outer membrane protein|nr:SusC/RagA family TonB-linked outer membrane protein [Porphyromonadaceae bacterium]
MKRERLFLVVIVTFYCTVSAWAIPPDDRTVTLKLNNVSVETFLNALKAQTGVDMLYNSQIFDGISKVSVSVNNEKWETVLKDVLTSRGLNYTIRNGIVVISSKKKLGTQPDDPRTSPPTFYITGKIIDNKNEPLAGASILKKGTTEAVVADQDGIFNLPMSSDELLPTLIISFIGFEKKEVKINGIKPVTIILEEDVTEINEIIVTGLYNRSRDSYTGSVSTYSASDLKSVSNQNIIQSLKTLDPAFVTIENVDFGSDPNTLPDIEIRGKTSIMGLTDEYGTNPNQPLFIVDGFESTLSYITDMSMDMIQSINILKDAASTAIWGSKAANGVVVIETRRPETGKLKLNYNGNYSLSLPDLSDYNLMNAKEKLEYERLSGRWGLLNANGSFQGADSEAEYMKRLAEVLRGVDTDWIHLPLRVGFTNKHTLFAEGGANEIRYGIGFSYGNVEGVMKGSGRETVNGNIRLTYRTGNLSFNNILNIDNVISNREKVEFSRFALMNPYLRKTDENGDVVKSYYMIGRNYRMNNPLWDTELGSFNKISQFSFSNNFQIEWRILNELRATSSFAIGKKEGNATVFISPFHTSFIGYSSNETGSYTRGDSQSGYYNGDIRVTYGKLFKDVHRTNFVLGFNFREDKSTSSSFAATGFVDDDYPNPSAAEGYKPNSNPTYTESTSRSASYYLNAGYAYDDRYLLDANFRMDGSSIFGVDHHFTNTWAIGIGWNIHKETFMTNSDMDNLKLRASIGNPGNQNFNDYISERVYAYNNGNLNKFGTAVLVSIFGNPNLKWQKTLDSNVGFDFAAFHNRLKINFDYFYKETDPLLVYIGTPSSTGVTSVPTNLGSQRTKGFNISTNYRIINKKDIQWSVNASGRSVNSTYHGLGNSLEKYNESNRASNNLYRYVDGASPNDLWAVRSKGIDPGTGKEIFVKLNGTETFDYDYSDEQVIGNTEPDVEGIIGSRLSYKGLSVSFNLRYRFGGQTFMNSLYNKVENVNRFSGSMGRWYNQDKRALYDRWQNPGDNSKFLGIKEEANLITSRFIMDNNILSGESITLSYETQAPWIHSIGASNLKLNAYMNDIFRIATIKNERGIEYPFAHSVSFSIGLRF